MLRWNQGQKKVERTLVALDVTADVAERAIDGGYDLILSHHPVIFSGLKSVTEENFVAKKTIDLLAHGVSVMSFHTRLDAVDGGVNDTLAAILGLTDVEKFGGEMGRVGSLAHELELSEFAALVKEKLFADKVSFSGDGRRVRRVAVLGGSGGDLLGDAIATGADTYLTGSIGYHDLTDAADMGINLVEAGHFFTENPICDVLAAMLRDMGIETDVCNSNRIKTI